MGKLMFFCCAALVLTLIVPIPAWGREAASDGGFLTADGARLYLNGREYRAIGVNIPHLHQAWFGTWLHIPEIYGTHENAKQAVLEALKDAQESNIAFVRFFANPGYPRDIDMLYARDKDRYWELMDELFALCREHDIKLIPSLHSIWTWQPWTNEPRQAILDPDSQTHAAVYGYMREFVTRYKDDPTVLMWELANEAMLAADVDMEGRPGLPEQCFSPGAPRRETYTREDSLTWDMLLRIYREQTAFIKELDPNHLVTSGDAGTRREATSRRETFPDFVFREDTTREWIGNNILSQPEPLDVYSFHFYGMPEATESWELDLRGLETTLPSLARATEAVRAPMFIGELGQMAPTYREDPQAAWTIEAMDAIEREGVSLTALWAWHFRWQPDHTISSATHPALTKRAAEYNRKWAGLD